MPTGEYCALVVKDDHKCVVITYRPDGCIKRELQADGGPDQVIEQLSSDGWEFAFRDVVDAHPQLFFRRPLPVR
jgi:hypothetical protein